MPSVKKTVNDLREENSRNACGVCRSGVSREARSNKIAGKPAIEWIIGFAAYAAPTIQVQIAGTHISADIQLVPASHFVLHPACALATLYPLVDDVARLRQRNPDTPKRIQKVTHTL